MNLVIDITTGVCTEMPAPPIDLAQQAHRARTRRNALIAACDWTQGRDIAEPVAQAWAGYRQALRDISAQPGFPTEITWPMPPNISTEE